MKQPLISIIIPLYNKEECIVRTIESILDQEFVDYEIVIVDDGSTDNSVSVLRELNDNRIKLYLKQNGGPSSARNYGVKHAIGKWAIFLDADDLLEKDALNICEKLIRKVPSCDFFCCNHYIQQDNKKILFSTKFKEGFISNNFFAYQTKRLRPRAGAALFSLPLLRKYSYDEQLWRYEDADFIFNIMRSTPVYTYPRPIMTYNRNNSDASKPRNDVCEDFIGHLSYRGKDCWEQLALYDLYIQGCELYSDEMKILYDPRKMYNTKVRICKKVRTLLAIIGYM